MSGDWVPGWGAPVVETPAERVISCESCGEDMHVSYGDDVDECDWCYYGMLGNSE